ncbi:MAG: hypothetical protein P1U44_05940 [Vicingaceae bacterium]|nr:hypothetical protein [Vicingaceae bacterium]
MKKKIFFILLSSSFLWFACESNNENATVEAVEEITEEVDEVLEEESMSYLLPSPLQIAEIFKNSGLTYIGDLTSPTELAATYNTKYSQKLNFGIYSADMAYCIINDQTQSAIEYLSTLRGLSEKMWMTDVFNTMGLSKRLEANVGQHDSLTTIMADLQIQLDDYLEENGMGYTGPVIFAGAWIETMYLGAKVNQANSNEKLIYRLTEQSVVLENLLKALEQINEDNDFDELIADLKVVNKNFDVLEEGEEAKLGDEQVEKLSIQIIKLRNKIINN